MKVKVNIRDRIEENAGPNGMVLVYASIDVLDLFETNDIPEEHEIDIHDALAERHAIALIWDSDQLLSHYPHLTDDQAWDVLQRCEREYKAEHGLTWDDIAEVVSEDYPDPDDFLMPERIARCEKALSPYVDSEEANLVDLLADLMHWSKRRGQSFVASLKTARMHFNHEDNR
jgi:hypothetical protein